jgi:hypothetical protein
VTCEYHPRARVEHILYSSFPKYDQDVVKVFYTDRAAGSEVDDCFVYCNVITGIVKRRVQSKGITLMIPHGHCLARLGSGKIVELYMRPENACILNSD